MRLSRHVKNNMRLYGISEEDIQETIDTPDYREKQTGKVIVQKLFAERFSGYPLKVVYEEAEETFVITAYPVKKAYRR